MKSIKVVLIIHNVRSSHNVGSLLRSADGFGINHVYFTGYTPYPAQKNDERLPHLREKIERQITKTALGAEKTVPWTHSQDIEPVISRLKTSGFAVVALEQTPGAIPLVDFKPDKNIALIVGNEVDGLDKSTLEFADLYLEIPMKGKKESFNVAVAGAIALYQLKCK